LRDFDQVHQYKLDHIHKECGTHQVSEIHSRCHYMCKDLETICFHWYYGLAVSTVLSIFETERISKVSEFLTLWTISLCSFKYISHNYRGFEKHQNFWYFGLSVSAVLSIYLTYRGFQKCQNFWYFGLPVSTDSFKYIWDREDFKSIRISDTLEFGLPVSAVLCIFHIYGVGKVSEFLILWTASLQF
jgi:hypothetical protein